MSDNAPEITVARGKIVVEVDTSKWDEFVNRANNDLDAIGGRGGESGGGDRGGAAARSEAAIAALEATVAAISDKLDQVIEALEGQQ